MEPRSELEQFLASRSAVGQVDSHGTFTLGAEEALRKISAYQLPFEGAWAVKIIQSIVAARNTKPIRVDLAASEIRFYFVASSFTLDEFTTAFHTPEPSPNRALRHLLSGLWAVGLKERWGFQIALPGQRETAIWDGRCMNRVDSPTARDCTCISVAPLQQVEGLSWVVAMATSGSRNAELLLVLGRTCYPCPVPLTVDGRRIDSLQRAEHHGLKTNVYPLRIGFAEAPLPPFGLPPGTFEGVTKALDTASIFSDEQAGGGWRLVAEKRMRNLTARDSSALAFILSVNMKKVTSGKSRVWAERQGPSVVYWILDGALVGTDPLLTGKSHCSLGCFLSAEGLETDLSTLQLLESPERSERREVARQALLTALATDDGGNFSDLVKRGALWQRIGGVSMAALSLAFISVMPFEGAVGVISGVCMVYKAGSTEELRVRSAKASIKELNTQLRKPTLRE